MNSGADSQRPSPGSGSAPADPWLLWAVHHATVFGLHTPRDREMLAQWCRIFSLGDFTPAEYTEATDWLALHNPPDRREQHLHALHERVCNVRSARCHREGPPEDPRGTCCLCDSTGLVVVPKYPGMRTAGGGVVPDNGYPYATAVLCSCAMGRWVQSRQRAVNPPRKTLEEYETEVARECWQEEMGRRHARLLEGVGVQAYTREADRVLGPIARRTP